MSVSNTTATSQPRSSMASARAQPTSGGPKKSVRFHMHNNSVYVLHQPCPDRCSNWWQRADQKERCARDRHSAASHDAARAYLNAYDLARMQHDLHGSARSTMARRTLTTMVQSGLLDEGHRALEDLHSRFSLDRRRQRRSTIRTILWTYRKQQQQHKSDQTRNADSLGRTAARLTMVDRSWAQCVGAMDAAAVGHSTTTTTTTALENPPEHQSSTTTTTRVRRWGRLLPRWGSPQRTRTLRHSTPAAKRRRSRRANQQAGPSVMPRRANQ